jgi:integrase/recombinase XerD
MTKQRKPYNTLLQQAKINVPGFAPAYAKFHERVTLDQNSKSMIENYSRSLASIALHFNRPPQEISAEEINSYLYRMTVHEKQSASYFKQAVYGMRHWYRLFGMEEKAIQMPALRKEEKLPVVLSQEECIELFKAPRSFKHKFMLAFTYAAGLRLNELRALRVSDVDLDRKQIHVRQGKGKKDRYVVLSTFLAGKMPKYIAEVKPLNFLFEGLTSGEMMGESSLQNIVNEALMRTTIKKKVTLHTLRHSFATHLMEDGVDIHSIQRLLGHADVRSTMIYLHVAQAKQRRVNSPLDTLYGIKP